MHRDDDTTAYLRAAGVSLLIELTDPVPRILHWGADLGDATDLGAGMRLTGVPAVLNNALDATRTLTIWPTERDGWSGSPAQAGHAAGAATTPRPRLVDAHVSHDEAGGGRIRILMRDEVTSLDSEATYTLDRFGVLSVALSLTRPAEGGADAPYDLEALRALMPVPARASEVLDFSGKWVRERSPQRGALRDGSHVRRARRGKPGHDSPFLLTLGTPGFGFGHGELWSAHLAFSGDAEYLAERLPESAGALRSVIGVGELLRAGEIRLTPGERYDAPLAIFTWSDAGLDGLSDRLHRRLRARATHPSSPRPLTLNTWEAVYFDHDLTRLSALVERASAVGVERLVLDDGWFRHRRSDRAGLGDWYVDEDVWPEGLEPLVTQVRAAGMQFGLWFEPEMISPDSDLAREHPEWILAPAEGLGGTSRHQQVLDIARPEAWTYLLERISALVAAYDIDYLKWDHNRDLLEAVAHRGDGDRPAVHRQTRALYRLLDELRRRHPGLEIETCSAGGGRVDLGILERTDRVWASDCNDPVERSQIERWTRLIVPPELIGSHLGDVEAHTTSRVTDLSFRFVTALTAHAGIEADLTRQDDAQLAATRAWADLYRELRPLVHSGRVVNADLVDDATQLTGIIAQDGSRALFTWARLASSADGQVGRIPFPGLDAKARYGVRIRTEIGQAKRRDVTPPEWISRALEEEVVLPGAVLATAGVPLPTLDPQQAMLFDVRRLD
ncbi:alpha-galactosidase [Microbacterium sp. SORGH_AS_0862]|uniref:alpha-galactosidase n=1 Tax=Microbacterium sp. SORGH_AS_0862 TaxID=3041789 RepID=UPI00278FFAFC|nr:alpha-galactosidase [Microbacterium sp. SORGH_AS_0862]MDQ1204676.1 alpha-galactosidase [Microbacterium sp. SORGH_AS_0862]